jgi:ubiquitin thioesterase protein OTUB1
MGKECDQPQIAALTEALQVGVRIEYLDGSAKADEELQCYVCAPTVTPSVSSSRSPSASPRLRTHSGETATQPVSITLLYRPGHYDILYPRAPEASHPGTAAAVASSAVPPSHST